MRIFYLLVYCFSANLCAALATDIHCTSCALQRGEITCIGGIVAKTEHFLVQQDYAVPIPGFMIISSVRHIQSIDEFTSDELTEFISLMYQVRYAMRQALGISAVYVVQEEDDHHFHLWLFPRYEWMKDYGEKIRSVKPIMIWAQEYLNSSESIRAVEQAACTLRNYINSTLTVTMTHRA